MKVYSIGRESSCNIVISDRTDVVSRRHATLNVTSTGKMTIVDQSQNGTYVNGMRIASNVPFPVTRKDSVSFAHVARLDWNLVPNPFSPLRYAAMGVIALIVIAGAAWGGYALINGSDAPTSTSVATDTTNVKEKSEEDIKKAVMDSIEKAKAVQDSIAKAKQDSINKAQKAAESKKKPSKKSDKTKVKKEEPAKENKPQEEQVRIR